MPKQLHNVTPAPRPCDHQPPHWLLAPGPAKAASAIAAALGILLAFMATSMAWTNETGAPWAALAAVVAFVVAKRKLATGAPNASARIDQWWTRHESSVWLALGGLGTTWLAVTAFGYTTWVFTPGALAIGSLALWAATRARRKAIQAQKGTTP